jgi:hypothetical protein
MREEAAFLACFFMILISHSQDFPFLLDRAVDSI